MCELTLSLLIRVRDTVRGKVALYVKMDVYVFRGIEE